ncbi:putative membrane protein YdjX (TVP38/TMEM64 family) [Planomicrobium koreense]|uniref:TVP38/TMEM64 family membrane protein n=1 Tax=Planococcus koreensis TaxID=112331 RepID=A0A7W8CRC9_9BACL|nr:MULTISPECIES: TVP38/TMEM64 family protein [Planococcus]MBB5179133.1 putative membrane protein YdjX (TVP38/TMEM64 family) [Planococcus koreensis]MDN3450300.1 TVP38/TMEM64 family protein [Planococcus sp. APC 3906]
MADFFSLENIIELTQSYRAFGPLIGFLLPFLEAFLPFLPLFVFVFANATAYGLWFGFLLSWLGTVVGAYAVFLIVRKYGQARFMNFMTRHEKVQKLIRWVERNGFGPLFLLLCFPFTPSALVNLVAGLSNISRHYYLLTVMAGKLVMVFIISFVGYDIRALFTQPLRTAIVIAVIVILYVVGKIFEKRLHKRVEEDFRQAGENNKKQG